MGEIKIDYSGTRKEIADLLRQQLAAYDDNPLRTWRWCSGFMWGVAIAGAMDFADVWLCVGACGVGR